MSTAVAVIADLAGELTWHAWQASMAGLVALALAALLRRRAPGAAALVVSLALLKFIVPPVVRVPIAFGDLAAMLINPFVLVPSGVETSGTLHAVLAAAGLVTVAIAALVWAGVARRARQVRRLVRQAVPATNGKAASALERAAVRLQLRVAPALVISDDAEGPFATGVWRPTIVLPRALAGSLDAEALEVVIAHELVHHRRRDLPMAWCAAIATTVFWFTPVSWKLARLLAELREECCDAEVLARGFATPHVYAGALLSAAAVPAGAAAMPMRDGHPLERRLRRVLDGPAPLARPLALAVVVLFALLCFPATPFSSPWPSGDDLVRADHRVERIVIR
jgi:beta-lactamase regulating signal transducer with metallopeptidase domain